MILRDQYGNRVSNAEVAKAVAKISVLVKGVTSTKVTVAITPITAIKRVENQWQSAADAVVVISGIESAGTYNIEASFLTTIAATATSSATTNSVRLSGTASFGGGAAATFIAVHAGPMDAAKSPLECKTKVPGSSHLSCVAVAKDTYGNVASALGWQGEVDKRYPGSSDDFGIVAKGSTDRVSVDQVTGNVVVTVKARATPGAMDIRVNVWSWGPGGDDGAIKTLGGADAYTTTEVTMVAVSSAKSTVVCDEFGPAQKTAGGEVVCRVTLRKENGDVLNEETLASSLSATASIGTSGSLSRYELFADGDEFVFSFAPTQRGPARVYVSFSGSQFLAPSGAPGSCGDKQQ